MKGRGEKKKDKEMEKEKNMAENNNQKSRKISKYTTSLEEKFNFMHFYEVLF